MIKSLSIGIVLVLLFFGYALYQGDLIGVWIRLSGYAGFGLIVLALLMLGSTLGVDRINLATPDVKRDFVVDDNNEAMRKERKLEQRWALYVLLAGLPSFVTWIILYYGGDSSSSPYFPAVYTCSVKKMILFLPKSRFLFVPGMKTAFLILIKPTLHIGIICI